MVFKFKEIRPVPSGKEFIDVILSKTQRKTPTVVRRTWKITRIRSFYARKVKFTQENYRERLSMIVDDFPRLEELHPFYSSLVSVLYSRDHYKLALGQINHTRMLIDNLGKDYLHLMKFGDSLYRCKHLKRAALGRMCTAMKKLTASLSYLEQVRQHMSRLPSIDPTTRTLLITGYPNVGKSSFINKISRAEVDVQPYAFTTKSVFVGHFDYRYLRWQVIDTPGLLDKSLEQRNTIEMQAVTALAHLHSCVLYFIDISEQCGYTIEQQVALYHSIKPLFANKPLVLVCNKTDARPLESLDASDRALIATIEKERGVKLMTMSNITEEGVHTVKTSACDQLLKHRVAKQTQKLGTRLQDVASRIHIARPAPRDGKTRGVFIPPSVQRKRDAVAMDTGDDTQPDRKFLERDMEAMNGGAGVYEVDFRKHYLLANPDWKYDSVPEIMDGKNIADHVDPEVDALLDRLDREEEMLEAQANEQFAAEDAMFEGLGDDEMAAVGEIREQRRLRRQQNLLKSTNNKPVVPRTAGTRAMDLVAAHLDDMGVDASKLRARSRSGTTVLGKRARSRSKRHRTLEDMKAEAALRPRSKGRMPIHDPEPGEGVKNKRQKIKAEKMRRVAQRPAVSVARSGPGDHRVYDTKPKHLFSGKRGIGSTDRR